MLISYQKRLKSLQLLFFILYTALATKLYVIQVQQKAFFTKLGKTQYTTLITTNSPRGLILDRNGQPLALNTSCLSAFITPHALKNPETLIEFLKSYFPDAAAKLEKILEKDKETRFMYVKRFISDQEQAYIQEQSIKDIYFLKEPHRFYPCPPAGIVVGITNSDNKGITGIEQHYNNSLTGVPACYFLEQEARSGHYYFDKKTMIEGAEGKPITLTLDSALQATIHAELKNMLEKRGAKEVAALVIDPTTGDIHAMVQYPDFNPNERETLQSDYTHNRLVTQSYELGSVMKIFLALAALEEGIVTPEEIIDCEGKKSAFIQNMQINTVAAHGLLSFSEVIEKSNNIGTSKIALRLGPKLYEHYKKCGFAQKTGLNFLGEQSGFITPLKKWSKRTVLSLSFGYEIRATLLQLASAFSLIARNGKKLTPRLILSNTSQSGATNEQEKLEEQLYSPKTIEIMREILKKTITKGTAQRANIKGYTVLGKTGTANLLVDGAYQQDKNIFTFAGLIEKDDYKRVIITFVKEVPDPKAQASSIAAPLFERVANITLIRDKQL